MTEPLQLTFLGTGTSVGVPVLTCDCEVCRSDDPRDQRLRTSALLEWRRPGHDRDLPRDVAVLLDTSTDLRQQALRQRLDRVDAVIYTHQHADHLLGLDELRMYNFVQRQAIPLYGNPETMAAIGKMFAYAFDEDARGVPRLQLTPVTGPFELLGRRVVPVPVQHGRIDVNAYRIGGLAYVTDCNAIPESSAELLRGADVLVLDALRRQRHPAHFSLEEALAEIERLEPRRAFLTHLSHDFGHEGLAAELPPGVEPAHDGLVLEVTGE